MKTNFFKIIFKVLLGKFPEVLGVDQKTRYQESHCNGKVHAQFSVACKNEKAGHGAWNKSRRLLLVLKAGDNFSL